MKLSQSHPVQQTASQATSKISSGVLISTVVLISILQAFLFLWPLHGKWFNFVGVGIAVANLSLAIRFLLAKQSNSIGAVFGLYLVQFILFIVTIVSLTPPPTPRFLYVALLVLHAAMLLSAFFSGTGFIRQPKAILLCLSLAGGILLVEGAVPFITDTAFQYGTIGPQWVGTMQPYPGLGAVYRPGSTLSTLYPDNPRGYFKKVDERTLKFWLRVDGRNEANLLFSQDDPKVVRIETKRIQSPKAYDVQLNASNFKVAGKQEYTVSFQARADQARSIFVGFAMSHAPWDGLGLYKKVDLTESWQTFSIRFSASASDDNARIHFDVGDSDIPVEFTSVNLRGHPSGNDIEQKLPPQKFFVNYHFNSLGCRDRDYAIPKPNEVDRILFLGDSFTLGVGVHEQDTLPRQFEALLTAETTEKKYEVINCGISGYGTHEERLFYQLFAANYQPEMVLLVMVWNDDLSYSEEFANEYVKRPPGKLEFLFHTWAKIQQYRYQRPFPNFTKCVDEILRLDREVRNHNSRLGVVIYRNDPDYDGSTYPGKIWNHLTRTVANGLEGENIPVLDVGKSLFEKHSKAELDVHPTIDHHPNEIANAIAAQEILRFLRKQKLLSH